MKEMANIDAEKTNQNKFIDQTVIMARFDKQDEDNHFLDEIEIYNKLNKNRKITKSDIDNIDVRFQLEQRIQKQVTKNSG